MPAPNLSTATRRMVSHLKWRLMYAVNDAEKRAYLAALAALMLT